VSTVVIRALERIPSWVRPEAEAAPLPAPTPRARTPQPSSHSTSDHLLSACCTCRNFATDRALRQVLTVRRALFLDRPAL